MFNKTSLKVPLRDKPTHSVIETAFFIPENEFQFNKANKITDQTLVLQNNEMLIVYDHGLGINAAWSRVKKARDEQVGYVMTSGITPLAGVLPFFAVNKDSKYYPDNSAQDINWKSQTPNVPYEDLKNGVQAVHVELEDVVTLGDQKVLVSYMEQARVKGTKLILDNLAFNYSDETLKKLLNNFYLFSSAEEWFIDPRPCSTLRVLVVIPNRYLYAESDLLKKVDSTRKTTDAQQQSPEQQNPELYTTITFENYDKYKRFFDRLTQTLERYQVPFLTKKWIIEPEGIDVNFLLESQNIKKLVESTNQLIYRNQPQTVQSITTNILLLPELQWNRSLDLVIDKKTLAIRTIKYYSGTSRFSLDNGLIAYLRSPEINNKTTINYILSFDPEKDYYDPFALEKGASAVQDAFSGAPPSPLDFLTKAQDVLGSAAKGIGLVGIDDDINNFLTSKHYPKITKVTGMDVDLFNCTVDTVRRIKDLESIKLPSEINKWKALNAQYERKKLDIEGDLFIRTIKNIGTGVAKEQVRKIDPNLAILFGINPLSDKNPIEKLATYYSVARSIDWAKFLGVAAQCLSQPIPIETLLELMEKYKEARKFIEQIMMASVCNPYLKNGLKIINGFELPVIKAYNPNETLARELETAFIKIINDLIAFGIKKALEAAAKACLTNPNARPTGTGTNPFGGQNPLDAALNANDPAVTDLIDLAATSPNGLNANITDADRAAAKEKLGNILQDISACLTLTELCTLYNGNSVKDETFQIIISLVKRKYGSPYADAFATRQQITNFFKGLGRNIDLSVCENLTDEEGAAFGGNNNPNARGANLLCDDGRLQRLRESLLADKGLTPDLIDQMLKDLKKEEVKALEDILKLLNSDNPFDFSQVPDLGCKVFPSGETIAPSMESFTSMMNSMLRSVYDGFDREAVEWYKTTYSIMNNKVAILEFDQNKGQIKVKPNLSDNPDLKAQGESVNQNKKGSSGDPAKKDEEEKKSKGPMGNEEVKVPSYVFKKALTDQNVLSLKHIDDPAIKYTLFSGSLDGDLQQRLDLKVLSEDQQKTLKAEIQYGESLLANFAQQLWYRVEFKYGSQFITDAASLAADPNYQSPAFFELKPIVNLLYSVDVFLKNNPTNSEILKSKLKNAYKVLGVSDVQEANGFFAAENAAAVYLVLCEMLSNPTAEMQRVLNTFLSYPALSSEGLIVNPTYGSYNTLRDLLEEVKKQYNKVKNYYRAIIKMKVDYPDFDINYQMGLNKITLSDKSVVTAYLNNNFYDIQKLEVYKNKNNYIKITEINKIPDSVNTIINGLSDKETSFDGYGKEKLFEKYLLSKGATIKEIGAIEKTGKTASEKIYGDIFNKINDHISKKLLSKDNKFMYLREVNNENDLVSMVPSGSNAQPYTQTLKLVLPQTPAQKACGIRPSYLDIDAVKENILQEKSSNVCVEKALDDRVLGNKPIDPNDLKDIETNSTQNSMLRGLYRLTTRIYLHDFVLRAIPIFGIYDPQSLRGEPMFITFLAKMTESEMRGMDNSFYNLLTEFLLKTFKKVRPEEKIENEELKKSQLFRDLVEIELKNFVLPKLAKRINADTNNVLQFTYPFDTPIKLINIIDDVQNMGIFEEKNNKTILKIKSKISTKDIVIYDGTIPQFIASDEFKFFFRYLFPVTQILTGFFVTSCLATTTRKQVINTFRSTKRDVMTTCKIVQANGQKIANDPNDIQSSTIDPMEIIIGMLLQFLFTTPRSILKGVAESSEPNIALTSTAFKLARAFVPQLTSFLIPAVSIPLGTLPTPLTPVLPFMNLGLTIAYFATFAWYDDKPLNEAINNAAEELEKNIASGTGEQVSCADVKNQDNFYLDGTTRIPTVYDINFDKRPQATIIQAGNENIQKAAEKANKTGDIVNGLSGKAVSSMAAPKNLVDAVNASRPTSSTGAQTPSPALTNSQRTTTIQKLITEVKRKNYTYTTTEEINGRNRQVSKTRTITQLQNMGVITAQKISDLVNAEVVKIETANNIIMTSEQSMYYTPALNASYAAVTAYLKTIEIE